MNIIELEDQGQKLKTCSKRVKCQAPKCKTILNSYHAVNNKFCYIHQRIFALIKRKKYVENCSNLKDYESVKIKGEMIDEQT